MGLCQLKSSSCVSVRERLWHDVAVLAKAGARVLWPVHSLGCPVCATPGS